MSIKLAPYGVVLSTDENNNPKIQRIDCAKDFELTHQLEQVTQLKTDAEAVEIVRELVIDNYIETIHQDLENGDKSLLYALLSGQGLKPISKLTEQELITEAIELQIF